nr:MAG TPA: hypothetical protein [Caudoviricetes sp.]
MLERRKDDFMAVAKSTVTVPVEAAVLFSKNQVLAFDRYANRRDLLSALLKDEKKYTIDQVDKLIQDFMKGKVK